MAAATMFGQLLGGLVLAALATATAGYQALGPYMPVSDVLEHSEIMLDVAAFNAKLTGTTPDYVGAQLVYQYGNHSCKSATQQRTLQGFALKVMTGVPLYEAFKSASYSDGFWDTWMLEALQGTGTFQGLSDQKRVTSLKKGVLGLVLSYAMYELESGINKGANANTLSDSGSAHAWDEGWAFYYGADPESSPWKVSEKRDGDFSAGTEVHTGIVPHFNKGLEALRAATYSNTDAVAARESIYKLITITHLRAALKYLQITEGFYQEKAHAEGYAYYMAVDGWVHQASPAASQALMSALDITQTSIPAGTYCTAKQTLEAAYSTLGIDCAMMGDYVGGGSMSCPSACSGPTAAALPSGIAALAAVAGTETQVHCAVEFLQPIGPYQPVSDVLEHSEIMLDVAAFNERLTGSAPDYDGAKAVYQMGSNSCKSPTQARTLEGFALKVMTGVPLYEAFMQGGYSEGFWNTWMLEALDGTGTFQGLSHTKRVTSLKKGVLGLVLSYAAYELESGISKGQDPSTRSDSKSAHAWDEGWAFYYGADPDNSPWKVSEKRDGDFPAGTEVHTTIVPHFNKGLEALRESTYSHADAVAARESIYKLFTVTHLRAALKYLQIAENFYQEKAHAEGYAYYMAVDGWLHQASPAAAQALRAALDIQLTSIPAGTFCSAKQTVEAAYTALGIDCAMMGDYVGGGSISCPSACSGSSAAALPQGRAAFLPVPGSETQVACAVGWLQPLGPYQPVSDVSEHAEIMLDVAAFNDKLTGSSPDYAGAQLVYQYGHHSCKTSTQARTLQGFAQKVMTGVPLYEAFMQAGFAADFWDTWMLEATQGTGTFAGLSNTKRVTSLKKGVLGLVLSYAAYELESGINKGLNTNTRSDSGSAHAWDEGWAFYYGADPESSPWKVSEKRDGDFPSGSEVHTGIVPHFNKGLEALRAATYSNADAVAARESIYKLFTITHLRAALKYLQITENTYQEKAHAEGYAYYMAVDGWVHQADSAAAQTLRSALDIQRTSIPAGTFCSAKQAVEAAYATLGIDCAMMGDYVGGGSISCPSPCGAPTATALPQGRSALPPVIGSENSVDCSVSFFQTMGAYQPVSDVSEHAEIMLDVALFVEKLSSDTPDYEGAQALYLDGQNSCKSPTQKRTLTGFATKEMTGVPLYEANLAAGLEANWWDTWMQEAFAGSGEFAGLSNMKRAISLKKGVLSLVLLYAAYELESGINKGLHPNTRGDAGSAHAWDEGWAFYYGADPENSPWKVAEKRDDDFPTGFEVHTGIVPHFNKGLEALRSDTYSNADAVAAREAIYKLWSITHLRAALKYLEISETFYQEKAHAEGYAYYLAVHGWLHSKDATAAATMLAALDIKRTSIPSGTFCAAKAALEAAYPALGIDCTMMGSYSGSSITCPACSAAAAPALPQGRSALAPVLGSESSVDCMPTTQPSTAAPESTYICDYGCWDDEDEACHSGLSEMDCAEIYGHVSWSNRCNCRWVFSNGTVIGDGNSVGGGGGGTKLYFSVPAFVVLFRESLEVMIVLVILLQFLKKSHDNGSLDQRTYTNFRREVWVGACIGFALCLVFGVGILIAASFLYDLFEGDSRILFEGIMMMITCLILTYLALSFYKMIHSRQGHERKMRAMLESTMAAARMAQQEGATGFAKKHTFFVLALTTGFREGMESIVFLIGVVADVSDLSSLPIPIVTALICSRIIGWIFFRSTNRMHVDCFMKFSSCLLLFIAAGFFMSSTHKFQELDVFGTWSPRADRPWQNQDVWNWSDSANDKTDRFFVLMRALFGYQDQPTPIEFFSYGVYWIFTISLACFIVRRVKRKTAKWLAECAEADAAEAAAAEGAPAKDGSATRMMSAAQNPDAAVVADVTEF